MRLVGGPWAGEGLLEVYWYGAWMALQVPAASLPVSSSVAAVVCRSLGTSPAGESPAPAKRRNLRCPSCLRCAVVRPVVQLRQAATVTPAVAFTTRLCPGQ